MNPVAILYILSIGCFVLAGLIAAYLVFDWLRLNRRLREDQRLGHDLDPVRTAPNWIHEAGKRSPESVKRRMKRKLP